MLDVRQNACMLVVQRDGGGCSEETVSVLLPEIGPSTPANPSSVFIQGGRAISQQSNSRFPQKHWHKQDDIVLMLDGYLDDRKSLCVALGFSFEEGQALTDAALALAAWKRWGESSLSRLHGPITLALADLRAPHRPQIVLYREPLGRRGLYYFSSSQLLLVASEPSDLLAFPAVSQEPDDNWLITHFALSRPTNNRTPFRAIRKLLPGECLICTPAEVRLHRTPLVFGKRSLSYRKDEDYAQHFRELLAQALARCLRDSGERTGIMLSGGMDSGPLAALAQRRLRHEGRKLTAYSWSLPDYPNADEGAEIAGCASYVGCELRLLPGAAEWPMRGLQDWPVNPNSPLANCFRRLKLIIYHTAAADGCSVILYGAAGDNLYPHPSYRLLEGWRDRRFGFVMHEIAHLVRTVGMTGIWFDAAVRRLGKHLLGWRRKRPTPPPDWLSASAQQNWCELGHPWPPEATEHARPDHYLAALDQWAADGVSEEAFFANRCGIDCRDPFHDSDLIDFMLSIPSYRCYRNGQTKWLARESMKGLLPESIRLRPRGGLLNEFFDVGYARQIAHFRRILSAPDVVWPTYVDHAWLARATQTSAPSETQKLLVWYCVAFELWRQALSGEHPDLLQFAHGTP